MATVNITEILGSDSISGSRVTINSNFLILQNWINGYTTVFGVDGVNGILNLTQSSIGRISAKSGYFNTLNIPSSGTSLASVNSAGQANFSSVSTTTLTSSGSVNFTGSVTISSLASLTVGGTASYNGNLYSNSNFILGPQGSITSQNTTYKPGLTSGQVLDLNTAGGGGVTGGLNSPYSVNGLEDVIYADCSGSGFYMKVVNGNGATAANISSGKRITIVNTSASSGSIQVGLQGSPQYYTGFNTLATYGGFSTITIPSSESYRSSITLQWEPRIAKGQTTQNGSWVVLSAINMTV